MHFIPEAGKKMCDAKLNWNNSLFVLALRAPVTSGTPEGTHCKYAVFIRKLKKIPQQIDVCSDLPDGAI